jgi:UDP-N-acetylmuramoyl-L-alanyl-D-glutamate--2,6-diaminopimelate ligase
LVVDHELDVRVPQVVVSDVRSVMGPISSAVYGDPSHRMDVVGVTGTNGKTTTTHLLRSIFRTVGRPAELVGTITGSMTTPEAPELQRLLADFLESGVSTVAMEVSSHALVQHRVDGMRFAAAVFTNLGHDHLDLHGNMETYFQAKASLFRPGLSDLGVVNADDEAGRRIANSSTLRIVTYSLSELHDIEVGSDQLRYSWRGHRVVLPLGGAFNLYNSLAAATTAVELGLSVSDVAAALGHAESVPGRFEAIRAGQGFAVVVDYAHTPDGLESVLLSARQAISAGRVLVVFGCGGDRDRGKRSEMGHVATERADLTIVTSDNPRSEDPRSIMEDILLGVPPAHRPNVVVEPDRAIAIEAAFRLARPGDVVVLAGKGHETTQTIGDQVIEFDDRVVARRILEGLL